MNGGLLRLIEKLKFQIGDRKDVEILSIIDNRTMSIGKKRTKLFQIASGKYTCIIDDDDDISDDFVSELLKVTDQTVDVSCYNQLATISGRQWVIRTNLNHDKRHPFAPLRVDGLNRPVDCNRPPWHWCAWNTEFAKRIAFGDSNCHEDAIFVMTASTQAKTQVVLDKVLCYYNESQTAYNSSLNIDEIKKVAIE
jgi:hypothetical protein